MGHRKIAHINMQREQTIKEHLENVAKKAADFCADYRIENLDVQDYAYQTGLAHDIGKYSDAFQKRIRKKRVLQPDSANRRRKNHIFFSCFIRIKCQYHKLSLPLHKIWVKILYLYHI